MVTSFEITARFPRRLSTSALAAVLSRGSAAAALFLILAAAPASSAIRGTVINATTGKPAARVAVTLVRFGGSQGMAPVDEVYTDGEGKFSFDEDLQGSSPQVAHGMLRAEHEGVSYSKMIVPDTPLDNVTVEVYSAVEGEVLQPEMTALLFEPSGERLVINQFFQFSNTADPPKTYRDPDNGTLQFYLPPETQGDVQVRTTGPSRMPLQGFARKTDRENVYMVDFPLKPGDNLVELTYSLPYDGETPLEGRVLYDGLETRFVVPEGVTMEAENLNSIGQEPHSRASIYEYAGGREFSITLRGEGRLSSAGGEASGGGGGQITIAPAPVAKELVWVVVITTAILGLGFYNLLTAKAPPDPNAAATQAVDGVKPSKSSGSARSSKSSRRRR